MIHPITALLVQLIDIYNMIIIIWVVLSLLIYFNIVNPYQPLVQKVNYILHRLMDPVLKHIRRFIPPIGGIDLSPMLLIILLQFVRNSLLYYF